MVSEIQSNQIASFLEQQYKVYEDILRLSKKKTDIIVEGKVAELENIVKLEQALVLQISRIDNQRDQLLTEMFPDKKDITISEIKELTDNKSAKILEEWQNKLTDVVDRLKHANQLNAKLIKNSLEYIEFSLNLMSNTDVTSNNYGNQGGTSEKTHRNFFDMKL